MRFHTAGGTLSVRLASQSALNRHLVLKSYGRSSSLPVQEVKFSSQGLKEIRFVSDCVSRCKNDARGVDAVHDEGCSDKQ